MSNGYGNTSSGNNTSSPTGGSSTDNLMSPTVNETKIELKKEVISNKKAKQLYEEAFDEIIISDEIYDDTKLIKIYDDLFYQISKYGNKSHENIINRSYDIVYPEYKQNLEDQITIANNNLIEKNEELLQLLQPPHISSHPYFSNGEFIREGEVLSQTPVGNQIWFIQQGFKRPIAAMWLVNILRKSQGETLFKDGQYVPLRSSINFKFADADQLNSILEAQDINGGADLSIPNNEIVAKENQTYLFNQLLVEFECHGVEKYHEFSYREKTQIAYSNLDIRDANLNIFLDEATGIFSAENLATVPTNRINEVPDGYWYLDQLAACELTYQVDKDPTEDFVPETHTITWSPSTGRYHSKRHISRDSSLYISPSDPVDEYFYTKDPNTIQEQRFKDGIEYPQVWVVKDWGEPKMTKYPQVIQVKSGSRIGAKIFHPTKANGSPIVPSGFTQISGINRNWPGQENLFDNNPFSRKSANGQHRMVNPFCYGPAQSACYGQLTTREPGNIIDFLSLNERLANVFQNPSSRYYHTEMEKEHKNRRVKGKVYGQPILLFRDTRLTSQEQDIEDRTGTNFRLVVFLGARRKTLTDWNYFYDIERGGAKVVKNNELASRILGYKRRDKALFEWFYKVDYNKSPLGYVNNPFLMFPGLQGYKINDRNTDLDIEPSGGATVPNSEFRSTVNNTIWAHLRNLDPGPLNDNPFNIGNNPNPDINNLGSTYRGSNFKAEWHQNIGRYLNHFVPGDTKPVDLAETFSSEASGYDPETGEGGYTGTAEYMWDNYDADKFANSLDPDHNH